LKERRREIKERGGTKEKETKRRGSKRRGTKGRMLYLKKKDIIT
jgi:hypothetical protein